MVEQAELKPESLLDLDDLLQCPVCYEIPSGQIFQCNEGHHVCGRCKMRLDVCPVCRALFFGTRNYAMEELIANFRKLKTLKSAAAPSGSSESSTPPKENTSEAPENETNGNEEENVVVPSDQTVRRAPPACKGLFRCLCCKNGNTERLPAARLLNHLRYFHGPDLLEGRSENGEYLQAWQISTSPGRVVTGVRIADMGIFFFVVEITGNSVCAWLTMAASPWVVQSFSYTLTISGNDREATFSDSVWSVRSCEGTLKKRGHCLIVRNADAQAMIALPTLNSKLCVKRTPADQLSMLTQPRAVLRIANRVNNDNNFDPLIQELEDDMMRLSREFATLDRGVGVLAQSAAREQAVVAPPHRPAQPEQPQNEQHMSRNARRRLRQRLRVALTEQEDEPVRRLRLQRDFDMQLNQIQNSLGNILMNITRETAAQEEREPSPPPPVASGPSTGRPQNGNNRAQKKKRRQRR